MGLTKTEEKKIVAFVLAIAFGIILCLAIPVTAVVHVVALSIDPGFSFLGSIGIGLIVSSFLFAVWTQVVGKR